MGFVSELMGRFNFRTKFALLGAIVALVIAFQQSLIYNFSDNLITPNRQELFGIITDQSLTRLIQAVQQHRGLSAGVLAGNQQMAASRTQKAQQVQELFDKTANTLQFGLAENTQWIHAQNLWKELNSGGLSLSRPENFERHTALVQLLQTFKVTAADSSALTLDPEMDSYYLMMIAVSDMPTLLEQLAQIRGKGTGILTAGSITEDEKIQLSMLTKNIQSQLDNINTSLGKTGELLNNSGVKEKFNQFNQRSQNLAEDISTHISSGKLDLNAQTFFNSATQVIDLGYDDAINEIGPALQQIIQARLALQEHQQQATLAICTLLIAIFALIAIGAYSNITNNVELVRTTAGELARGNLTSRVITNSRDEFSVIADSINQVAEAFSAFILKVQREANEVTDMATNVASATSQLSESTRRQSDAASGIAAAIEELTASVDQISRNADVAREMSNQSGHLSQQGLDVVERTNSEMRDSAQAVEDSAQRVNEFGKQSAQISDIVNIIGDIANQTNLLALNAAIEAARAGESGRGFAVVADEVRNLAARTAQCTQQITDTVTQIRSGTSAAVESMQSSVVKVNNCVELSQEAGTAINGLNNKAMQVAGTISEISHTLREQSSAATEIAQHVERIARLADENYAATNSYVESSKSLQRLSRELSQAIQRFQV